MTKPVDHQWVIPSDTAAGQEVQESIIKLLEQNDFSDRDVFGMRLALEEGIVNAIKHGNRMDISKKVHVDCKLSEDHVRVVIRDEGPGFKPEEVPDPTADENIERPCGRGIMLMRAFMSLIEYNDKGNVLTLEKRKESSEVKQ
ncbi:ATP-binding protein [Lacunimicrobium album]|jgi:Anti-sigma regulatory factor (Ser/Thr protein kinase)